MSTTRPTPLLGNFRKRIRGGISLGPLRWVLLGALLALSIGHLLILVAKWGALSWAQITLLLGATALFGGAAAVHRTLCERPIWLLLLIVLSVFAHGPSDALTGMGAVLAGPIALLIFAFTRLFRSAFPLELNTCVRRWLSNREISPPPQIFTPCLFSRPPPFLNC